MPLNHKQNSNLKRPPKLEKWSHVNGIYFTGDLSFNIFQVEIQIFKNDMRSKKDRTIYQVSAAHKKLGVQ